MYMQGGSSFTSPVEDENSREIFGLIKKLNIAPVTKKRGKTVTCKFLLTSASYIFASLV